MARSASLRVGDIHKSNAYGLFKIVERIGQRSNREFRYLIEFLNTGYRHEAANTNIKLGNVRDMSVIRANNESTDVYVVHPNGAREYIGVSVRNYVRDSIEVCLMCIDTSCIGLKHFIGG